jgi:hypothetical protein
MNVGSHHGAWLYSQVDRDEETKKQLTKKCRGNIGANTA